DLRAACGEADPRLEVARLEESCGALRRRHALIERWAAAEQAASKAAQVLLEAATRAGFVDTHDALSSLLPREERRQLEEQLADHDARLRAAETVLADPEIRAAAAQAAPDVASLATRAASALASAERSAAIATLTADRHRRAESLIADLRRLHHRWAAADETADLAASLSTLVEGTSPDNHARLRLSAYVLSHRLGQVIAAANERLETMSDHRYRLEHTTTARGGLGLSILDDWSGESRDPMTLSGGETFVVSLALALGLADVISVESGATVLDTLFVDEGFGALDSDTLSDVLDTIDGLREGGRVVGLVSHVPEMRERIPTRVEVHKERTGSTVRLVPTSTPTAQC
ncbi:MAG: SMC family ATPase, partial [Nocardioides sp.]